MKAINVQVYNYNQVKAVSNATDAINFLKSIGFFVNPITESKINETFSLYQEGKSVPLETRCFSMGNNPGNPTLRMDDVTGLSSKADIKRNAKIIIDSITNKYPKLDLRLSDKTTDKEIRIEGGLYWYWNKFAGINGAYCPVYDIVYRSEDTTVDIAVQKLSERIDWALEKIEK
ncbi:hypothetical protein JSO59_003895 [Riemerella anatipestifer]|uniref:hypothetical protein n=1 Tax=Riemerella anatipestifer TaxID=34085 RepID=UPI0030BC6524